MENTAVVYLLVLCFLNISLLSTAFNYKACKKRNGNFPKPGSFCRAYYRCKNWKDVEIICPEDQHFFPSKGYCVWPEVYPCLEKRIFKECPTQNGKFPVPGSGCKRYYECCNGKPSEKKCPEDTLFDHIRAKCEWPELYTCNDKPVSKKCPLPNGKFLKSGSGCKIYYECYNGKPTEKKCPGDQRFDRTKGTCEWPELFYCEDDSSEEDSGSKERPRSTTAKDDSSEESSVSSEETQSTPRKSSKTPWPFTLPSTFPNNISVEITTPTSLTYEETTATDSVSTTLSTTPNDLSVEITTSSSYSPFTDAESLDTDSTAPTNSSISDYPLTEISTSNPPFTNEETDSTSPTLSSVSDYPFTEISTSYPPITNEETDSTAPTLSSVSDYPLTDISTFYPPFTNEETDSTAPTLSSVSDYPLTEIETSNPTTINIFCPELNGYFPHPTDKHKFIGCVGGDPRILTCPSNLVYDHMKRACVYGKNK